jgi:hypothetical protein
MKTTGLTASLAALLASIALPACGGDDAATSSGATGSGGSGAGTTGSGGAGGATASGTGGAATTIEVDGGAGGGAHFGCSADLRSVVDGKGATITTCPADQGCSEGACIDACAAAAASHGSLGCDFYVPTPPSYPFAGPPCFAVFLANAWPSAAKITVEYDGASHDVGTFGRVPVNGKPEKDWPAVDAAGLPGDEVAVLFLSGDPNAVFTETGESMKCPVPTAVGAATSLAGSGLGHAFHIRTTRPVNAYDILPYGGAHSHFPGATLLMPTSAWEKNYVVIAPPKGTFDPPGPLWGMIVGAEDGTTVDVLPSVALPAVAGAPATPAGAKATYTIDAGQMLEWQLPNGTTDLSGTVLASDKPIAVFAGNRLLRLQPKVEPGGEEAHAEVPPVSALGSEYVAAPWATRRKDLADESIPYRLVGAVDGTTLTFDPPVAGAPATLDRATVADFAVTGPFRVTSQDADHPFAFAQLMPTANVDGGSRPGATAPSYPPMLGDEEFVIVQPPPEFLSYYVFFTDPTYPTTNLVITRAKGPGGFADVEIPCLGKVGGWQSVGAKGDYEVTNVDLVRAGVPVGSCQNGRQTAKSAAPFGLVVWGEDSYSSYAYPAGGNAAKLSNVTVPATPK